MAIVAIYLVMVTLAAFGVIGVFTRRAGDPAEIDAWARAYGLSITGRNRPTVTYYVRLAVVTRVVGGVAGIALGSAFDAAFGLNTSAGPGWWAWVIGGWTFGAWWAEREVRWPRGAGVASLVPRRTADYLPGRLRAAPYAALGLVTVLAAVALLAPEPDALHRQRGYAEAPAAIYLLTLVGAAAVVTALTQLTVWRTVSRRQPPLAPDLLAADDAIRTSAAHQLAGGGTAVVLCMASVLAGTLAWASATPRQLNGLLGLLGIALWLAAIVAWRYYTYRAWRVRRVDSAEPGPALVAT